MDSIKPNSVADIKNESQTMLDLWLSYLTDIRSKIKSSTLQTYTRCRGIFEEFLVSRHKHTIKTDHLTFSLIIEFESWMMDKYSPNQSAKVLGKLSSFCHYARKNKCLFGLDIDDIKYKQTSGRKIYLTVTQIEQIKNLKLTGRLDRIRDLMLLQALTSVRISDLFKLKSDMLIDGNFEIRQKKTGKLIYVKAFSTVLAIMKKYDGNPPQYSEQQYRMGIKDVYKIIDPDGKIEIQTKDGIKTVFRWEEISSHDMIRTYIMYCIDKGISTRAIAAVVGKTEKIIIKHYMIKDKDMVLKEFEGVDI